jgi:hypothetical protein
MELACEKQFDLAAIALGKVLALQDELFKMPQADIVTEHTFLPGVYERKIVVPPWTVLTGAEHKVAYRVRLEKGTIAVTTEDGVKTLTGPREFEAPAGTQRAGRVFDDEVIWVDIYDNPDDCTDVATLEDRLYVVPEWGLGDSRTEAQKAMIAYRAMLLDFGVEKTVATDAAISAFKHKPLIVEMA